ncbi:hypothetical protein K504DRAFT_481868 [Pleomassaria siparia CBS 279.74]|uniref:Zn(2)-C6 fungal-type domain-containing protein n=1 Tax=Pleomassaria siparia CBS 279.74 TaxID=1314801 RepID=A0A6G1K9J3_9PLEO|nr:hypothetical protein K504DRAFT_481868 [Pleomassaria siparia CBS 279.74]
MSFQNLGVPGSSSKVPIPRLEKRGEPSYKSTKTRERVQRACLTCRARKVKCNGGQPTCSNCNENQAPCIYVSSRKDKLKTAIEQNQDMIRLLRDLRERAVGTDRQKIEAMLVAVVDDASDASSTLILPEKPSNPDPEDERGEANISAEVGSNGDVDILDEDLHCTDQSRATGFIGKNSEVQWIRRLHHEADHSKEIHERYTGPYGPPGISAQANTGRLNARKRRQERDPDALLQTSSCNFYLDDENIHIDFMVDPFELPPFETAERLLKSYMESVQDSFPILAQKSFISHFYQLYTSIGRGQPSKPSQKWQAILNLVFAIGACYSHLTEAEWRADERDHLLYYSRAWALYLKDSWWLSAPDLSQMQLKGLLSFYFLAVGQISRAWLVIGTALRIGYALGMHVRNEDPGASAVKKELFARVWWAFYSLEQILSVITGRPSAGQEAQCSVPAPTPLSTEDLTETILATFYAHSGRPRKTPDPLSPAATATTTTSTASPSIRDVFSFADLEIEPANSGSYLNSTVKIGMIAQKALLHLYSPKIVSKSWESIQGTISELCEDLEAWAASLPPGFRLFQSRVDGNYSRERLILEIYYHDTKILITRPCLRHIDLRIEHQTKGSHDFNQRTAATCVSSAKSISSLLPTYVLRDRVKIYQGPWWSIVHNIMQAITVLLLELSYGVNRFPKDLQDTVPSLKKLVRWLRVMKINNGVANRAYAITMNLLQKLIININIDVSDLLAEDMAASTPNPIFQFNEAGPEEYNEEYLRLTQEHTRHLMHNHNSPYNYAMSNPFGLPHDQMQSRIPPLDPSSTFQDFYMGSFPSDSPYANIFGAGL